MSDWKPKNTEQALGFEMGKSFVQGFTDQLKEKDAEIERLRTRLEESCAKPTFKEWERNVKLIRELADALEEEWKIMASDDKPCRHMDLVQRARESIKP